MRIKDLKEIYGKVDALSFSENLFSVSARLCHDGGVMRRPAEKERGGFTLLEILLVIALIGLLGGFLLMDWGNLAQSFGRRGWQQSIEESFRRGHFLAETRDQPVRLRFDPEERLLILEDDEAGTFLESESLESVEQMRRIPEGGAVTSLGADRRQPFFSVRFGRDGSAEPILLEVIREGSTHRFRNHPFSGRFMDPGEEWGIDGVAKR